MRILPLREQNRFLPDIDELRGLVNERTRLIAINNPNNPTGSSMDIDLLTQIAEVADTVGAFVLCDEVYRGVEQERDGFTESMADLYPRCISTASMSKEFSLAGLRLGWVAGPAELIEDIAIHRDYNKISVGLIDDLFTSIALEHRDAILDRSRRIVRTNLAVLDDWGSDSTADQLRETPAVTTALLKCNIAIPSEESCIRLLEATGVMFTPRSALDMEGFLRIGYANGTAVLTDGLKLTGDFFTTFA